MITDKERENREELFRLMRENPDLPVLPVVDTDVVGGSEFASWLGTFGKPRIKDYLIDEWYGDGCIRFRGEDDEDSIVEGCAERKYGGTEEGYRLARKEVENLWTRAIVIGIGPWNN